jgi:hypothetical protein
LQRWDRTRRKGRTEHEGRRWGRADRDRPDRRAARTQRPDRTRGPPLGLSTMGTGRPKTRAARTMGRPPLEQNAMERPDRTRGPELGQSATRKGKTEGPPERKDRTKHEGRRWNRARWGKVDPNTRAARTIGNGRAETRDAVGTERDVKVGPNMRAAVGAECDGERPDRSATRMKRPDRTRGPPYIGTERKGERPYRTRGPPERWEKAEYEGHRWDRTRRKGQTEHLDRLGVERHGERPDRT